ncbi:MAG: TerB family tellurite resistance protein [Bacteroidales bacterium]|nr:TerB family tellurite resistance protein [Bacteroidales bacterium]
MGKFGKWIGAGLGWTFGGALGAIIGFAFGSFIDISGEDILSHERKTTTGDFIVSLLTLIAGVMKADGRVLKSELDYVKAYFVQVFGRDTALEAVRMLKNILEQEIPLREVCMQVKQRMDYSSRLQLVHFLFGIANADGQIDKSELRTIEEICGYLGIAAADIESTKNMFVKSSGWAYKILEIDPGASDEEVKKAYRMMAVKHHPDKVSYLGEDIKRQADEKFKRINEAYETIKKERGIK